MNICFEDCPTQELEGHDIIDEDIWVQKDDPDNIGTLKEVKDNYDNYSEGYDVNEIFTKCTPKGTIIFF